MIRSAVLRPIPEIELNRFASRPAIARVSSRTVKPLKAVRANLGPMPLTVIRSRNIRRSAPLMNP
jgi:hypothetical protein